MIYLEFGFVTNPQNAVNSRGGRRIIKALTNHYILAEFGEILEEVNQ